MSNEVEWAGRKFGQLTADEKKRVIAAAGKQLTAELQAAAPLISEVLDGHYHGLDLERLYAVADIIQQQVLESRPVGTWWTIGKITDRGKGQFTRDEAVTALAWLAEHQYILTNGRGGCWVNYARKS